MRSGVGAIAVFACAVLAACSPGTKHSPQDYANAVALEPPEGSFTTMAGANTAIAKIESSIKYPQGDTESGVRSILMFDGPSREPGMCLFQQGHAAQYFFTIVKEAVVTQPCDGKRWAHVRIVGSDFAFVSHLKRMKYKGTPITLLEISDQQIPQSIKLIY